jgi:hypothetical protein
MLKETNGFDNALVGIAKHGTHLPSVTGKDKFVIVCSTF